MFFVPLAAAAVLPAPGLTLDEACSRAARAALTQFSATEIKPEHMGLFVMARNKGEKAWKEGGSRADFAYYPASVVKLFYLACAGSRREEGKLTLSEEDRRAFHDMIVDSSNDATGHVVDILTGTTGGPELSPAALKAWMAKRQSVNKWLKKAGIEGVNACQKTWNEGPYGREKQGYGKDYELRNLSTSKAAARMMAAIVDGRCGTGDVQSWMLGLLHRSLDKPDSQARLGVGKVAPKTWTFHSKAGMAYEVVHDVAYLVSPQGDEIILSIFTDKNSKNLKLVPFLAESILKDLAVLPPADEAWKADDEAGE